VKTTPFAVVVAATVWFVLPPSARADLKDAVNRVRTQECPMPDRSPLRSDSRLRQAARRMAAGVPLHQALISAGYLAEQSSAVHLTGAVSDAQVARILAGEYCGTLTDRRLGEIGAERQGRDVWIILAAPADVPSAKDSSAISRQILELVNKAPAALQETAFKMILEQWFGTNTAAKAVPPQPPGPGHITPPLASGVPEGVKPFLTANAITTDILGKAFHPTGPGAQLLASSIPGNGKASKLVSLSLLLSVKQALESGTYHVSAKDLAQKLIDTNRK